MGIRSKMLLTVAVPLLVLLLTGIAIVGFSWLDLSSARNAQAVVTALGDSRTMSDAIEDERYSGVTFLDSLQLGRDKLRGAQEDTNAAYDTVMANLPAGSAEASQLAAEVQTLVGARGSLVPDLRAVSVTSADNALTFPTSSEATQLRINYSNIANAVESLAATDRASVTGTTIYLNGLANSLNAEGLAALQLFTEPPTYLEQFQQALGAVDDAIAALTVSANNIPNRSENQAVLATIATGSALLDQLDGVRGTVESGAGNSSTVLAYYTQIITLGETASLSSTAATANGGLTDRIAAYGQLDVLNEALEYEKIVVQRLIRAGQFGATGDAQLRTLSVRAGLELDRAQGTASAVDTLPAVPEFSSLSVGDTGTNYVSMQTAMLGGLDSSLVAAQSQPWAEVVDLEEARYQPIEDQVWGEIVSNAQSEVQALVTQLLLIIAAVVGAFLVAVLVANAIARRIVNPLRRLTTTATAVRQELPRLVERVAMPGETVDLSEVQIPVESEDEVGRLAEAFNGVNAATLSIAAEQAALRGSISEMFVNVARRDQVLLNRQLASIDEMERSEDDPDTLTKLFALDHLATRMRRNSESLLVLAGIDTGRRLRRPMPLSDVVRTASSEIELYERVQLELDADPQMVGHSALTAAHLFAEILENATVFSDPGSPVIVRTTSRPGGFLVEIIDSGIGMNPEELHNANARVSSNAASEILGAQRLGLFVVGRIARRIGAKVEIASAEGSGTAVTVVLPSALFDDRVQDRPAASRPSSMVADEVIDNPLTGPAEAAGVTRSAAAGATGDSYAPSNFEEGASLSGRGGELPARGAAMPTRGAPAPTAGTPAPAAPTPVAAPQDVQGLIADDAAAAPEGTAIDSATLIAGATAAGLPARRRRAPQQESPAGAEPHGTNVIGLPQRATAEQLSALEGEAGSGFTPMVSAAEVAPQSAEQRAAMFRGFRSSRAVDMPPAAASAVEPADAATEQPMAIPSFEPEDDAFAPSAQSGALAPEQAAPAPRANPGIAAAFAAGIAAADAAQEAPVVTGQSPLIQQGFGVPQAAEEQAWTDPGAFEIPTLEDDEEPFVGVESVSLVDDAAPAAPELAAQQPYWQQEQGWQEPAAQPLVEQPQHEAAAWAQAPEQPAVVPQAHPAPALQDHAQAAVEQPQAYDVPEAQQPQAYAPQPVAAQAASPAVGFDDLIHADVADEAARGGFFNRLFGRGRRDDAPQPTIEAQAPAPSSLSSAPSAASAPAAPYGSAPSAASAPFASAPSAASAPTAAGPTAYAPQPTVAPSSFAPSPALEPEPQPQPVSFAAPPTPVQPEPFPQQPAAFAPEPTPTAPVAPSYTPPAAVFAPQPSAPSAQESFMPAETGGSSWSDDVVAVQQMHQTPAEPAFYSPDQLARPVGWEAAGASALEAAGSGLGYRPVVQIDPEPESDQVERSDVTSAVFSEFSSLTSERPKIQKTKAGLVKREPVKTEEAPQPLSAEVTIAAAPRDADAVRRRFSNFYSGTQRARSDVAAYQSQSPASDREQA
ncbi:ATP-binding protein [Demequina capsici]|uniref:histidine kinase n=1 Tax=Demequina capsici TaxID=3075620 RepID=A0AA96FFI6_9MICO|nr:ATP-binding protein [Demequina sp. PMTSA13]WNM27500.1 ATP-binding protein [Demequina sp. PMTSA13]